MPILPPTVHERLARCGTHVRLSGLIAGADVVLIINGTVHNHVAAGSSQTFAVPAFVGGEFVEAQQDDGSGLSNQSPGVTVEAVDLPPASTPQLPGQVGWCSQCVRITGLVPGCEVELLQQGATVGKGTANRHGNACGGVKLRRPDDEKMGMLSVRMIVCGQPGPLAHTPIVHDPPLASPLIGSPLYGCQSVVPLSQLNLGHRVRLRTNIGTDLGSFCTCWHAVNVNVAQQLVVGEKVQAQPYWASDTCQEDGPWSDWRDVVQPDEGIRPELLPALIENDALIRVANQIPGSELKVLIRDSETSPITEFGPRPANENPADLEIALAGPLQVDQQVSVVQELCGHKEQSEWLTVPPGPIVVLAPVVLPPLYACAGEVQVSNLHQGATVRIFQNGVPIGIDWSGTSSSLSITASPGLVAGRDIHAVQWVGGQPSPQSAPVTVQTLAALPVPRILQPVAVGDNRVWVSGVAPGARVSIRSGGVLLGEAHASETIVSVPVNAVPGIVQATVSLCDESRTSGRVESIVSPCAAGEFPASASIALSYPDFQVPVNADGGDFTHPIMGQFYYPADASGNFHKAAHNLPLVVIAHGYWDPNQNSYLGYGYLAHHLARWGICVYSINMDEVNRQTSLDELQQLSRGEIILEAIRLVLADSDWSQRINADRIGIVGHSMSGEGVAMAQHLNFTAGSPLSIRGVASIAPTHYKPDVDLQGTRYLQLYGSNDQLLGSLSAVTNADAQFGGFRIYDRAARPKTHFWIYEARHNGFNTEWFNGLNLFEEHLVDVSLGLNDHRLIATCLMNAFFQDALKDQGEYAGYLQGVILPPSVRGYHIFSQHHDLNPDVIDNFGDADTQLGFMPESPFDKTKNRVPAEAKADGPGLGTWDDVDHIGLLHSVHETNGLQLSWTATDVEYWSETGGIALAPTQSLSLRVSQFYEDAVNNPVGQDLDLFVELFDGTQGALVRLGLLAPVPYPDASAAVLTVMRTGRLPIDAFMAANPALNTGAIQRVRLVFMTRPTGHLLVDDVEFLP